LAPVVVEWLGIFPFLLLATFIRYEDFVSRKKNYSN